MRKMFSNGRARSGIIVLPCGAGKTLTGITAACTLQKSTVVLTTSAVAVEQWKRQFSEYTTIASDRLLTLTADTKQQLWPLNSAGVLISTYTMLAFSGKRSAAAEQIMSQIKGREWGLLVFDEVQFAPAPAFRRINDIVRQGQPQTTLYNFSLNCAHTTERGSQCDTVVCTGRTYRARNASSRVRRFNDAPGGTPAFSLSVSLS